MQKKSEDWQENLNKQTRGTQAKKFLIWGAIILACFAGLGGLVFLANKSAKPPSPVTQPNLPKVTESDIIEGEKNAKLVVTEYADFQCPACANYNPILNQLLGSYKGKIKVVYRFFPLTGIHKNAVISGQAAYAANMQGKFPEMKDLLYDNQKDWENLSDPKSVFEGYAKEIELNSEQFKKDMNSSQSRDAVLAGEKEALGLGLNSTPSFFIGNKYVQPGGYEDFKALIDAELKK